jgi:putative transposase
MIVIESSARVERLMRQAGLSGLQPKHKGRPTVSVPGIRVADDLLDCDFAAGAPNRCWVTDITYLRTWEGWLYLVAVQDLYSRRIVGWAMADHMRTELVVDALQMALAHRRPDPGLIWHSDQGSQFVSLAFGQQARPDWPRSCFSREATAAGDSSLHAKAGADAVCCYPLAAGREPSRIAACCP